MRTITQGQNLLIDEMMCRLTNAQTCLWLNILEVVATIALGNVRSIIYALKVAELFV